MPEIIMRRLPVDTGASGLAAIAEAVAAIRRGGVVAIPTDTLYGLAANPFDPRAVDRVFDIKGRRANLPLPLIAADLEQVAHWIGEPSADVARLAQRFWPGPLTLLLPAPASLAPAVAAGTGKVGVRVPDHAVARALCRACGEPLTATSANRSGEPATADPDEVARTLGGYVDVLLDSGPTRGGPPSTVVDVGGAQWTLVRAGAVGWDDIQACRKPE